MNTAIMLPRPLHHPLPELASTILHFVADDWSGSGNWTSRDSSATVATVHGSPAKVLSSLPGRFGINNWSAANNFTLTFSKLSADRTIEIIYKRSGTNGGFPCLIGGSAISNAGDMTVFAGFGDNGDYVSYANSAGANTLTGGLVTTPASKLVFATASVTTGAGNQKGYLNGVPPGTAGSGTTANGDNTGTLSAFATAGAYSLEIGAQVGNGNPCNTDMVIFEIMVHNVVLSAAVIAARAAQYNAMRGY